ncbi:hypothetical protein TVAG_253140 [Trichomonas vaginalis G3]|uniref:Uncharacterized protein n=1 Tax=Trichomonas vaginalis (strain ATCC PRA-98 / G3) TaxID=412133 RepID=A2EXH3_TRIV3|nr:hypothetical protein TVAGG3_0193620 [Trichomonas vaginalis G3]EAY02663.1 hypothetical protein TVAG_253140 [Trichomonas vaginalis G3]KAI5550151.1 hypothetical protein TVAGG3_0193620 [Trichomonas vaginalis G3]|eukprot:XP_001314886.1 hypothetical protein [Trichomonas vaginalis G3]
MLTPYYGGNPAYYDDDYDDDSDDGEAYYDFSEEDLLKSFYNMPFGFLQQILLDSYMSDDFESRLADRRSREPYDEYMYDEIYEQSDDLKSKLSDLVSQKVKNYEIIQWFLDKRLYFSNDMYSKISEVTKVADINKGIIKFKESVIKWSNDSNKKEYEWLEALAKFSLVFELVQRSQETDLIAIYIYYLNGLKSLLSISRTSAPKKTALSSQESKKKLNLVFTQR